MGREWDIYRRGRRRLRLGLRKRERKSDEATRGIVCGKVSKEKLSFGPTYPGYDIESPRESLILFPIFISKLPKMRSPASKQWKKTG
jgi:hypothetical protein